MKDKPKEQKQNKLSSEERQNMKRNRNRNKFRFTQGIKQLFSKKINIVILALFIVIINVIWSILLVNLLSTLEPIFKLLLNVAFLIVFIISILGVIMWFGKPKNAQTIEDDIKDVFNIKDAHKVPILVSITDKENNVITYKVYSPDFAKNRYEEEKINIEQKLGVKILDKIQSKGKYIIFDTISNENIKQTEVLKDDRI